MRPGSADFPPELAVLWHGQLARRVVRLGRCLCGADRAHPAVLDGLLVLTVVLIGLPELPALVGRAPVVLAAASLLGQALPLLWRRRAPRWVLAAVLAACVLQWSMGLSLHSALGLLVSLYAVARYDRLTVLPWAAACSAAGLGVAALFVPPFERDSLESLLFPCAATVAAGAVGLVVRVRRAHLDALADHAVRLEVEREQRVQLAVLAERSRVSREMHDIVGHNLAVIVGLADGAAAADADARADVLHIIADTSRQALSELRRTLGALRERPDGPPEGAELSPQPGIADLPALLERTRAAGPRIHYQAMNDADAVPRSVQLAAYRIVQEALTNSLKHAGPDTEIRIVLGREDGRLLVRVQDSGRPAQDCPPANESGHGLIGIGERAALTGGVATAGPAAGGGWVVRASLPLEQESVSREQRR